MTLLDYYFDIKVFSTEKIKNEYKIIIEKLMNRFGENIEGISISELLIYLEGPFRMHEVLRENKVVVKCYANSTYEKNINILKSFFNMIFKEKLIDINYAEVIEATSQNRSMNYDELPTSTHIMAIQEFLYNRNIITNYFDLRELVIFNLIFHSGLSTNELSSLTISNIGFRGNEYLVKVTQPRERYFHINNEDAKYLSLLLKLREDLNAKDLFIFVSVKHRKQMTTRAFSYLINEICKKVEINNKSIPIFSAEKFKKAGITAALSVGYPKDKMCEELKISSKYFNQRFKYVKNQRVIKSYADLFTNE